LGFLGASSGLGVHFACSFTATVAPGSTLRRTECFMRVFVYKGPTSPAATTLSGGTWSRK